MWDLKAMSKRSPTSGIAPITRSIPAFTPIRASVRLRAPIWWPCHIIQPAGMAVTASPRPGTSPKMESQPMGMPKSGMRNRASSSVATRSIRSSRCATSAAGNGVDGMDDPRTIPQHRKQDVDPDKFPVSNLRGDSQRGQQDCDDDADNLHEIFMDTGLHSIE